MNKRELAQELQTIAGYTIRDHERKIIEEAACELRACANEAEPLIEVVPLDTLCQWLAHYAAPPNFKTSWTQIADNENIFPLMEQLWKEHWRSMMEGK